MDESKPVAPRSVVLDERRRTFGELMQHIHSILSGPDGHAVDIRAVSKLVRESDDGSPFEFPVYRIGHRNGSVFAVGCASPGWLVSASLSMPVDLAEIVASGNEGFDDATGFPDDAPSGSYRDDPNRFAVRFMTPTDARAFFRRIARVFSD